MNMSQNNKSGESKGEKLYSYFDDDLPDRPKPQSRKEAKEIGEWRTKEIYRCPSCHTLTNKWLLSVGSYGGGPRLRCPRGGNHCNLSPITGSNDFDDIKGVSKDETAIVDGLHRGAEILRGEEKL